MFVELVWTTTYKRFSKAYIRQLLGVSRQIIRLLGVSRLMYARHKLEGRVNVVHKSWNINILDQH